MICVMQLIAEKYNVNLCGNLVRLLSLASVKETIRVMNGMHQLLNIGFRGATLLSKFLLLFFLARLLEPADVGMYGLLTVTISYSLYFLGFDFYTYSTREVISRKRVAWVTMLKSQGVLTFFSYIAFLPLSLLVIFNNFLPKQLIFWFLILLILEHLNIEFFRFFIAASETLFASIILFIGAGGWGIIIVGLMLNNYVSHDLENVLLAWVFGAIGASILGFVKLYSLRLNNWGQPVDWEWIKKGLKIACPFLIATLCLRAIYTIDRYWIESLVGLEILAAYVLFISIGNAMISFLDAGVFSYLYPKLVSAYKNKNGSTVNECLKSMLWKTLIFALFFVVASLVFIKPLLSWVGKEIYFSHISLFYWVLAGAFMYGLSLIPHYILYAADKDGIIIVGNIAGFALFALTIMMTKNDFGPSAIPIAITAAFTFVFLYNAWMCGKYNLRKPNS